MKNAIKTISLSLLVALFATAASANTPEAFTDVQPSSPYYKSIQLLKDLGVVNGNPDGSFAPKGVLDRAALAKIMVIASDKDLTTEPTSKCFDDVELNIWYTKYICKAKDLGLVKGDGGTGKTYRPAGDLKVSEVLAVLSRAYKWNTPDPAAGEVWYDPLFTHAKKINILDKEYSPETKVTREIFAEITARAIAVQTLSLTKFENHDAYNQIDTTSKDSLSLYGAKYKIRTTYRIKTLNRPPEDYSKPVFRKGTTQ